MDHTKKILILYASAGHGHEKAAKALKEAFEDSGYKNIRCVDVISLTSPFFGALYREAYLVQIKYMPWLWGFFYYSFDLPWVYFFMKPIRRILNSLTARGLEKLLLAEAPDVMLATHFTAVEVASFLKGKDALRSKVVSVVTDYLPHTVWTADNVDAYAVAVSETKEELVRRGVPSDKIKVTGIPIESKFSKNAPKAGLLEKFGLKKELFTALVTSGGVGVGTMYDIVAALLELKKPFQILAVCGTNQKLYVALETRFGDRGNLKIFGFVDNMEEFMEASDVVIGKGGGLTVTESLSKQKPVILFRSIPGQEKRNADCVEKYRAGFALDRVQDIVRKISGFLDDPGVLLEMKKGAAKMARTDSAKVIVSWTENEFLG